MLVGRSKQGIVFDWSHPTERDERIIHRRKRVHVTAPFLALHSIQRRQPYQSARPNRAAGTQKTARFTEIRYLKDLGIECEAPETIEQ